MTETVWVVSNPSGGHQGRMHTDKNCARLKSATKVLEKERKAVESHRKECGWCKGRTATGYNGDTNATRKMLLDLDSDSVGGSA